MASVLTNDGEERLVDVLVGNQATLGSFIGWGSGAGTSAKTDTTLFTEESESRVAGTVTKTGSAASAKYQIVGTLTASAPKTITNAGTFTASVAGTLVLKGDFTGIVLGTGDQIVFTITADPS